MYRKELIRAAIVNRDMTRNSFGKAVGLSANSTHRLWDGDPHITLPTLIKAADFLGLSMRDLFTVNGEAIAQERT